MRIALIAHHAAPVVPPFSGGLEAMTWTLARWLGERGHAVDVFAPPGSRIPHVRMREMALTAPVSALARADVSMPPERFMDAHYAYQRLMLMLSRARGRYDLVHAHALHYLPVAMSELLPVPFVLTLHSPPTPWLEAALAGAKDTVTAVAVSEASRRQWHTAASGAAVIRNGVDLDSWRPGDGGPSVAWSGRIVPEKGPHLAILAAQQAGRHIRLAGPILDRSYWSQEIVPLLGGSSEYVGHLEQRQLRELIAGSAALVVSPTWDEPFGLVAAEAIAAGTPVAAFNRGGLAEVIGERGGVLAAPGSVESLATAITLAITLPRAGVRRHAERTLDFALTGRAYEQLYRSLCSPSPPSPPATSHTRSERRRPPHSISATPLDLDEPRSPAAA